MSQLAKSKSKWHRQKKHQQAKENFQKNLPHNAKENLKANFQGKGNYTNSKKYNNSKNSNNYKAWLSPQQKSLLRKKQRRAMIRIVSQLPFRFEKKKKLLPMTRSLLRPWLITPESLRQKISRRQSRIWGWQKRLRRLRHGMQEKPFRTRFFYYGVHFGKRVPTKKENVIQALAKRYQNLPLKDRRDFFRTYIGQMILSLYITSDYSSLTAEFLHREAYPRRRVGLWYAANEPQPLCDTRSFFAKLQQKSWWYETLVQKEVPTYKAKRFLLDRPHTAFQSYWKEAKKTPWKDMLIFRRALYAGLVEDVRQETRDRPLQLKTYLRHKNPRSEKRNRLYKRVTKLLSNWRKNNRILATKHARIRQLVRKIVWPFYGHLRTKQMVKIYQKSRRLQSPTLTRNEIMLSHFESRLDVVVYRLNLAPSILWARRLIQSGAIFIASATKTIPWEKMHAALKKTAFPLKLRDPYQLYSTTFWQSAVQREKDARTLARSSSPQVGAKHWATFRFLSGPQKKISYLLQPGDIIHCLSATSGHHFKARPYLYQKPIPTHLLTNSEPALHYNKPTHDMILRSLGAEDPKNPPGEVATSAVFFSAPRFSDLSDRDRVREPFFRWTIL